MARKQVRLVVWLLWVRLIAKRNQEALRSEVVRRSSGRCRSPDGRTVIVHRWLRVTITARPRGQTMDTGGKLCFMSSP